MCECGGGGGGGRGLMNIVCATTNSGHTSFISFFFHKYAMLCLFVSISMSVVHAHAHHSHFLSHRYVRRDFWPGFAKAAGVYTIGEVGYGEDEKWPLYGLDYVHSYQGYVDSLLAFPLFHVLCYTFLRPWQIQVCVCVYMSSVCLVRPCLASPGSYLIELERMY